MSKLGFSAFGEGSIRSGSLLGDALGVPGTEQPKEHAKPVAAHEPLPGHDYGIIPREGQMNKAGDDIGHGMLEGTSHLPKQTVVDAGFEQDRSGNEPVQGTSSKNRQNIHGAANKVNHAAFSVKKDRPSRTKNTDLMAGIVRGEKPQADLTHYDDED